MSNSKLVWHKVLDDKSELAEGRVMTVTAGNKDLCLSHWKGKLTALQNICPHQGPALMEITADVKLI